MIKRDYSFYAILLSIFLVNLLFKLILISAPSLWYDEIISVKDTLLDFGHIKHEPEWDKNPPFYHYVLWIWSKVFGITELGVRSMSAFFSALAAVLIFLFVDRITSRKFAYYATLIFTLNPYLYYYAQEARCYSLLIFLIMCSLFMMRYVIEKPSLFNAIGLGVINFLIFYTHYVAGLILLCQFVFLTYEFRNRLGYIFLIFATPVLLVLLRFTKKQYHVIFFSGQMSKEKSNVPLSDLNRLIDVVSKLFTSNIILTLFVILLLVFLFNKEKQNYNEKQVSFIKFISITPLASIVILYILGKITNVFDARYLIFTMPLIIISFILVSNKSLIVLLFTLVIVVSEVSQLKFNQSKRMDYKFCATLTKKFQEKENVNILIQTHDVVTLFTYYYNRDLFMSKERSSKEFLAAKSIYFIDNVEDLEGLNLDFKKPLLFFQTYDKKEDNERIKRYFEAKNLVKFSTNQIDGVKFTYLKARN